MSRPASRTNARPNDVFAINNRIQGINRNLNIQPVLGMNRVANNNIERPGPMRAPTPMPPPIAQNQHANTPLRNPTRPTTLPDLQTNGAMDLLNRFNRRRHD